MDKAVALPEPINHILTILDDLEKDIEDQQRNIYILAGVFGGVILVLIIAVLVLLSLILQLKRRLDEADVQKKLEEEMNAHKLTAYTGEELHRKLMAVTNPAVPLSQISKSGRPESEYAFNMPVTDDRLGQPAIPNGVTPGTSGNKFTRFN